MSMMNKFMNKAMYIVTNVMYVNCKVQAHIMGKLNVVDSAFVECVGDTSIKMASNVCAVVRGDMTMQQVHAKAVDFDREMNKALVEDCHRMGKALESVAVSVIGLSNDLQRVK